MSLACSICSWNDSCSNGFFPYAQISPLPKPVSHPLPLTPTLPLSYRSTFCCMLSLSHSHLKTAGLSGVASPVSLSSLSRILSTGRFRDVSQVTSGLLLLPKPHATDSIPLMLQATPTPPLGSPSWHSTQFSSFPSLFSDLIRSHVFHDHLQANDCLIWGANFFSEGSSKCAEDKLNSLPRYSNSSLNSCPKPR